MPCPRCGVDRVVLAASPGEQPDRIRVCLACAHLWLEERPPPDAVRARRRA